MATKKWSTEKKEDILGMYSENPEIFEFLPGQLLELEELYQNVKGSTSQKRQTSMENFLLNGAEQIEDGLESEKRPRMEADEDVKDTLLNLLKKYAGSVCSKENIQMDIASLRVLHVNTMSNGDLEARISCFCNNKYTLLVKKVKNPWSTSNFYFHIRRHAEKLNTKNTGPNISKYLVSISYKLST